MIGELSPALILILGGMALAFLRGFLRNAFMLALPAIALWQLTQLGYGSFGAMTLLDLSLQTIRIDGLSFVFALIFIIAAFLCVVYSLHVSDPVQQVSSLVYAGAALGAVLAGDLITLFVYWEITAIASVMLIWASRTERAFWAGLRYLVWQIGSGVLLLAGVLMHYAETKSIAFGTLGLNSTGGWLIFLAFGMKCGFPLLHNWIQDAYPESTASGTVWLSVFTTKLAVYALARSYAGTELLIAIGAAMTAFPIFFAVIENDLRKVLAYSLNNQLGFMVVGIGIGTDLALNGTAAHAFCHILYKALLFMSMGAVLFRVGTVKGSELGGLYKSMPWTATFCCIGAASISAFPLFSGFVSKSLIMSAAMYEGHFWTWIVLLFASAGVVEHAGIKVPFFGFFGHDSGKRCSEAPTTMLFAMGIAAFLCVFIGVYPDALYSVLPYPVDYKPYTLEHVVTQLQLLVFAVAGVVFLMQTGLYPPETKSINLDTDWFYRRAGYVVVSWLEQLRERIWSGITGTTASMSRGFIRLVEASHGPGGVLGQSWGTGTMAFWTIVMLLAYLVIAMAVSFTS